MSEIEKSARIGVGRGPSFREVFLRANGLMSDPQGKPEIDRTNSKNSQRQGRNSLSSHSVEAKSAILLLLAYCAYFLHWIPEDRHERRLDTWVPELDEEAQAAWNL